MSKAVEIRSRQYEVKYEGNAVAVRVHGLSSNPIGLESLGVSEFRIQSAPENPRCSAFGGKLEAVADTDPSAVIGPRCHLSSEAVCCSISARHLRMGF